MPTRKFTLKLNNRYLSKSTLVSPLSFCAHGVAACYAFTLAEVAEFQAVHGGEIVEVIPVAGSLTRFEEKPITLRHFKVTARVNGIKEPFVDWFSAENEAGAKECWLEDAHRYGLPESATTLTIEEVPELP